jgi:Mg2+ and Co2+ transporter CorA
MTADGRQLIIPERITTFTLYTPIALTHTSYLPEDLARSDATEDGGGGVHSRRRRRRRRPNAPVRGYTKQRVDTSLLDPAYVTKNSSKVLNTTSFDSVRQRLYTLRKTRIQDDNVEADLGQATNDDRLSEMLAREERERAEEQERRDAIDRAQGSMHVSEPQVTFLDEEYEDDEDGDLSLPPPALDLPSSILEVTPITPRRISNPRTEEQERYMSDVPLTPRVQMAKAMEFSRGFEAVQRTVIKNQSPRYSPILEGNEEQTNDERGLRPDESSSSMPRSQSQQRGGMGESGNSGASDPQTAVPSPASGPGQHDDESMNAAWWLDVTCPTYETMTELSQMFPLHPLTVEDVLMQEPREKIEIFDRLGYYFIVIRAVDERYFRYTSASTASNESLETKKGDYAKDEIEMDTIKSEKRSSKRKLGRIARSRNGSTRSSSSSSSNSSDSTSSSGSSSSSSDSSDDENAEKWRKKLSQRARVDIVEGLDGKEGVEGVSVGAINLYLIVFSHGIISFHFEDFSKHTDAVMRRLTDVTQHRTLTSDWIAHGLYDSVIDAFFPLQAYIDLELKDFELLMDDPLFSADDRGRRSKTNKKSVTGMEGVAKAGLPMTLTNETIRVNVFRPLPRLEVGRTLKRYLPSFLLDKRLKVVRYRSMELSASHESARQQQRNFFRRIVRRKKYQTAFLSATAQKQNALLRRITEARKISTGLTRLLQPKNDSIRGFRKHLSELRAPGPAQEEISAYIGDVHDHVVTLLGLMTSDENRLGDIHSSYLASIRLANNRAHHKTDTALITLIAIGTTVMTTLFLTSLFSINALTPRDNFDGNTFHWFIGIVVACCVIPCLIAARIWLWMRQAERRADARKAAR